MPLTAAEANDLTTDDLLAGVIETVIERGARDLFAQLPFRSFEGSNFSFNIEASLPDDQSAQNPYGTTINNTEGNNDRYDVSPAMLARNADTAVIDVIGKSNINDQRVNDIMKQAKELGFDLFRQIINGRTSGDHTTFYNVRGIAEWFADYESSYGEQVIYNTDDGNVDGTKQDLSLNAVDDLLSRQKSQEFDVIYTDRATWVYFKSLLNAAGGNTAGMLMSDTFGRNILTYDGVPVVKNDAIGMQKSFSSADSFGGGNAGANEIVVTDSDFLGFSTADEHETITLNSTDYTIDSVDASDTVTTTSSGGSSTGDSGNVNATNRMYAIRYDNMDGVTAVYHEQPGGVPESGDHLPSVSGFRVNEIGRLEDSERFRTRLSWYGSLAVLDPRSIARLSHYSLG